ncbi:MAG TPA: T9SS type B sorting domain-containing protein, partial [Bacteroidetes bacterium]|nr:T9SS type B sorting domain-containing protein [Bacteroidota bacterium]
ATSQFNASTPGIITFSWLDPNVSGVTVANGTVIYEICFNAIGPNNCNNSNQLVFTNTPAIIEILDGEENPVDFNSSPGVTTICDDPNGGGGGNPTPTNLTFTASSESALPGEELCVDVSVDLFECIVSAQYSMHFEPTILEFVEVNNFNLPGLVAANFGTVSANTGTITFSWLDPDVSGVSLANGTVIYSVCFNVIGSLGQVSSFTFDGTPTDIEVTNCTPMPPDPDFVSGTEKIENACPGPVNITSAFVTDVACFGDNSGSVDISVNGGDNDYTYNWTLPNGQSVGTNQDLTAAGAGTYSVVVSSCSGNETTTATYTINQPSSGISISGVPTPAACFGETTGAIDLTATGGTNSGNCDLSYQWSNGASTADISGIGAGAYVVTVTDCNNCQATASFNVTGPPSELSANVTPSATLCSGECSGQISVAGTGGVGPYQYMLNTGAFQNTGIFQNLCAGNYLVKTRDALGCIRSANVTVGSPPAITPSATVNNVVNGGDGSIDLSVFGGTPPLSFSWTGPNGFTSSNQDISGLEPGEYCVIISDANDCTKEVCETVRAPLSLVSINETGTCFGQCVGQLEVVFTGGIAPFTYQWSNGQTTNPAVNLCAGLYLVTVTSGDGQTASMSGLVNGPTGPIEVTNATIDLLTLPTSTDGGVSLSVTGGYGAPYTYQWSTSPQGPVIAQGNPLAGVGAGDYYVTITDSGGCTKVSGPYNIHYEPNQMFLTLADDDIVCLSDTADGGTLHVEVQGGLPPYTFSFNGPTDIAPVTNNMTGVVTFNNLLTGTYGVTITDGAPGTFQQSIVTEVDIRLIDIEIDPIRITPVTNSNDGAIDITVSGGDPIYTFQWSNGFTGQDPSNLPQGSISLFVQDANGCVEEFSNIQVEKFTANASVQLTDCPNDNNGAITLNPTGSNNTPYTYQWSNGAGNVSAVSGLPLGNYTVTITDTLGASIIETFTVSSLSNLNATAVQDAEILCNGFATGGAVVTPTDGMPPYTYLWSNGATTPNISGVPAGQYSVLVEDAVGCQVTALVNIEQPQELIVNVATSNGGDCTEGNGRATANVAGGQFPYEFQWSDLLKQTSKTAILLNPGAYTVTVVDDNGCVASGVGIVDPIVALEVVGQSTPDSGGPDGEAIAVVLSGTPPYTFVWRDYVTTDSVLTELTKGTYYVKVTDANGCEDFVTIRVDDLTTCLEASAIITPEGDGFNEEFQIGCLSRYSKNKLEIFNRWGQMVFLANDYNDDNLWRGTNRRGDDVPDGVYYFVFEYIDPASGATNTKKGAVTVLRQ